MALNNVKKNLKVKIRINYSVQQFVQQKSKVCLTSE